MGTPDRGTEGMYIGGTRLIEDLASEDAEVRSNAMRRLEIEDDSQLAEFFIDCLRGYDTEVRSEPSRGLLNCRWRVTSQPRGMDRSDAAWTSMSRASWQNRRPTGSPVSGDSKTSALRRSYLTLPDRITSSDTDRYRNNE